MKKFISSLAILLWFSPVHATHFFRNNASNINSGTLNTLRLDASSVTERGNIWDKQVDASTTALAFNVYGATTDLRNLISPNNRDFDLYIGSVGTPNVDATLSNGDASQSFDAMFALIAARGLTYASSGTKKIYLSNGVYQVGNGTIPAGVDITCGSSVTFTPIDNTSSIFTVYGRITGVRFDVQSRVFAGPLVQIKSKGEIEVRSTTGTATMSGLSASMTMFLLENSTYAKVTGRVDSFNGSAQDTLSGGLAKMVRSSDCLVNLDVREEINTGAGSNGIFISEGDRNTIDGNYDQVGGRMFVISGGNRGLQIRGKYHITKSYDSSGFIYGRPLDRPIQVSTGVVISVTIEHDVPISQPLIQFQGDNNILGLLITNCHIWTTQPTGSAPTFFVKISDSGVKYTVIADNHIFGMPFISDSGTGTTYTSLANTNDITKP